MTNVIVGRNGVGKTTLLNALRDGSVHVEKEREGEKTLEACRPECVYCPERFDANLLPSLSAEDSAVALSVLLDQKRTKDVASLVLKCFQMTIFIVSLCLPKELPFSFGWVMLVFALLSYIDILARVERSKLSRQIQDVFVDKLASKLPEEVSWKQKILESGVTVDILLFVSLYYIGVAPR